MEVANSDHELHHIESCQVLGYFAAEFHVYKLFEHGALDEGHDDIVSPRTREEVFG